MSSESKGWRRLSLSNWAVVVVAATVGLVSSGCSQKYPECQYVCQSDSECPGGFRCDMNAGTAGQGLCSSTPVEAAVGLQCLVTNTEILGEKPGGTEPTDSEADAGAELRDAAIVDGPEDSGSDNPMEPMPDGGVTDGPGMIPEPKPGDVGPPEPCESYNTAVPQRICLPTIDDLPRRCLPLSEGMQSALVQWLDPTSLLDTEDGRVDWWCDRSGRGNHAISVLPQEDYPMRISVDGEPELAPEVARSVSLEGNWLLLDTDPTALVFDQEDFLVMVGAAVPRASDLGSGVGPDYASIFTSNGLASYGVELLINGNGDVEGSLYIGDFSANVVGPASAYDGTFHLFGLRRAQSTNLQLRVDGILLDQDPVPASVSLSAIQAVSGVGADSFSSFTATRGRARAVLVFKGELSEEEVGLLEAFTCQNMALCPTVLAP